MKQWMMPAVVVAVAACGGGNNMMTPAGTADAAVTIPQLPEGWVELAPMPVPVGESAAVHLDGKIYVAGGYDTRKTLQIYDVAGDSWTQGPAMPAGTDNAGIAARNGKVFVLGGEGQSVFVYDVAAGTWSRGTSPPTPRFASAVEQIGSKVYLVGGWSFDRSNNVSVATHSVYNLAGGGYDTAAAASVARNHAVSGVIDGKLYVAGGRAPGHEGEDASNVAALEVYDPANDSWKPLADLPTPRSGGAGAVVGGKLYVLGGGLPGNQVHAVIERYDPTSDTWERMADLPEPMTGQRAVAVGGDLYLFGGFITANGLRQGTTGIRRALKYTPPD